MNQQIRSVQFLRAFAALLVAALHLSVVERKYLPGSALLPTSLGVGACGVDIFFVLSGFIISAITLGKPRRPGDSMTFLIRRLGRIYPIYWFYCALILPLFLIHPELVNSSHGSPNLWKSLLLIPDRNSPLVLVAWTLSFEVGFYLIYAVALRFLDDTRIAYLLIIWGAFVTVGNLMLRPTDEQPILHFLLSPLNIEFIFGCFAARAIPFLRKTHAYVLLAAGIAWFSIGLSSWGLAPLQNAENWVRVLVYGVGGVLVLSSLVVLKDELRAIPQVVVAIGDSSYSLYLSHIYVFGVVGWVWRDKLASSSLTNHMTFIVTASITVLVWSYLSYRLLELNFIALMKRSLLRLQIGASTSTIGPTVAPAEGAP